MTETPLDRRSAARLRAGDPWSYYARLRERGPIDLDEGAFGWWQVVTAGAVDEVLHDASTFSPRLPELLGPVPPIPQSVDPPEHAGYRRLLDPLFSPRRMNALAPDVEAHADDLIARLVPRGGCDLSAELAIPLPCAVFLSLLGVGQRHLPELLEWTGAVIRPERLATGGQERRRIVAQASDKAFAFFTGQLERARGRADDTLLHHVATARLGDRPLTEQEQLAICWMLMMAGLDTVTVTLECFFAHLANHPDEQRLLATDPGAVDGAVEELLRWETPVSGVVRVATRDTHVAGVPVPEGTRLHVMLASANLDPTDDARAGEVDLTAGVRRHRAFGLGPHRCLGSHLARMELRAVLRAWHRRIPSYRLADGEELLWNGSTLRGVERLPLTWDLPTEPEE